MKVAKRLALLCAPLAVFGCHQAPRGPLIPLPILQGLSPTESHSDRLDDGGYGDSQAYVIQQPIETVVDELKAQLPANLELSTTGAFFPPKKWRDGGAEPGDSPGPNENFKMAAFHEPRPRIEWSVVLFSGDPRTGDGGDFTKTRLTIIHFTH